MKGCDYISKSLSSPLLLPYLFVTKRQTEIVKFVTRDDELVLSRSCCQLYGDIQTGSNDSMFDLISDLAVSASLASYFFSSIDLSH